MDGGTRIIQRYEILKLGPLLDRLYYLTTPKHRDRTEALTADMRALGEVALTRGNQKPEATSSGSGQSCHRGPRRPDA